MVFLFLVKTIALLLFSLLTSYVLLFGKKRTGIKLDYALTAIILLVVIFRT